MLYTSPLLRAQETADIIGKALEIEVVPDERLKEWDVGAFTGLTWEQIGAQYPDVAEQWRNMEEPTIPGAEGRGAFRSRVVAAFDAICSRHPEGTIGIVTHGGVMGAYINHLIKLSSRYSPFRFGNGSLTVVEIDPVRPRVALLNDACHLKGRD
jgi:broad specificity phosphatase PhoE